LHVPLHQLPADQLEALAVGHGQEIFGRIFSLGVNRRAHGWAPDRWSRRAGSGDPRPARISGIVPPIRLSREATRWDGGRPFGCPETPVRPTDSRARV